MDQAAERVYQSVIALAQATARDVAEHLGLSTAEVTDCLDHLHSRGVIQPSQVVPGGWRAVNPAAAMGPLIAEQERRLARQFEEVAHTREVLDLLGDLYRQSERRREAVAKALKGTANSARAGIMMCEQQPWYDPDDCTWETFRGISY